jgi:hypothetical protein
MSEQYELTHVCRKCIKECYFLKEFVETVRKHPKTNNICDEKEVCIDELKELTEKEKKIINYGY